MPSPRAMGSRNEHLAADRPERRRGGRPGGGARAGADRDPPPTLLDRERPRRPRRGPGHGGGGASPPTPTGRGSDQRTVRGNRRPDALGSQEGGHRRRACGEAMTLWWIGNVVLLVVIVPVVVILLRGVLNAAKSTTKAVEAMPPVAEAASKDLDAV